MKEETRKIKLLLSEKIILYPVLIAILFLFNELRKNAIFYTLRENLFLVLIVLTFSLLINLTCRKIIQDKSKAALISAFSIFINLYYLDIVATIVSQKVLLAIIVKIMEEHRSIIIIPLLFFIWLIFIYLVMRIRRIKPSVNLYLNTLIIIFIFVEIFKWVFIPVPNTQLDNNAPFPVNNSIKLEQKPDIYYIILDSYTSSESLKKYWNFDNSAFEDTLQHLGFFVASKSKSDFSSTPLCMASYLNSSTLILDPSKSYDIRIFLKLIRENRLFNWLNSNNYLCLNYSLFDSFGGKKHYSVFPYLHFLGRTLWYTLSQKLRQFLRPFPTIPEINISIFNQLNKLPRESIHKPLFVYAHVLMPHPPYSFNEFGKPFDVSDSLTDKQKYLSQLIFTNTLTLKSITNILKYSKCKSIIVIQGDHGFTELGNLDSHSIFYAIYTPSELSLPSTFNPKDTFKRIIEYTNQIHSKHIETTTSLIKK